MLKYFTSIGQYPKSPTQNHKTFCWISTESSMILSLRNFLWKFHKKFHRFVSGEFPQKVLRFSFSFCGTFCENSTVNFMHGFIFVKFPRKISTEKDFGFSTETNSKPWKFLLKFHKKFHRDKIKPWNFYNKFHRDKSMCNFLFIVIIITQLLRVALLFDARRTSRRAL